MKKVGSGNLMKRGEIFLADLDPVIGNEQGRTRPVLIIQNDVANEASPVTIVAAITSKVYEKNFPTNVFLEEREAGLGKPSTILLNQIRTIDKSRLVKKVGRINNIISKEVNMALKISLQL